MIFLDVGAHEGQTLEEVTKPVYEFRRIYAFEPMPDQHERLRELYGGSLRVQVLPYGLADFTGFADVYGRNDGMEASLYCDKVDLDPAVVTRCRFVRATTFFAWIKGDQEAIVKLNCEGCEVPVMNDLLASGEHRKIRNVMIDFDVRKVPSMAEGEPLLIDRMQAVGFDRYSLCQDVMIGETHQDRIRAWLATVL